MTGNASWLLDIVCGLDGDAEAADIINDLLSRGMKENVNHSDDEGISVLAHASIKVFIKVVELLLRLGVNENQRDKNGNSAFIWAAIKGNATMLEVFLNANAGVNQFASNLDMNLVNNNGNSSYRRCSSRAESVGTSSKFVKTTEVIQTYVENHFTESVKQGDTLSVRRVLRPNADVRVNVDHTDCDGTPLLILAASRAGVVKTLVDAGANVNQSDRNGSTALIQAATNGHAAIVMILLNAKANADLVKCDNGWTALMAAAHEGHHKIVSILVRYGAPLDLVCHNDNTALMHAMSNGHGDIALVLLNAGADFSIVNKQGKTARAVARSNNHSEAARVLESFTTDPHFFEYVKSGDIHAVQQCVTYNLNIRDTVGATPILAAATQPSSDSETPGI
ncbi:hypothetical protein PPTG_15912 [Phytophthora nicotianae INRA-310]|uniref:Uncharacterized protein n=1 Tax=Phytophthora nicotianae (strain INRA-310) TaxID=761204 RepID=W2PTZ1_PHYN3|nr:hypothetical protein PPTG_15912 [Phytophthora nicotianae INRA-310]ETN03694.1 hypothetical protein PPTG_15912 [Phytophthora nicotianae INRA-310]